MEDTIAAISTPVGEGGIAIIRVSGPRAFDLADQIFSTRQGRPSGFTTHTIHFGTIGHNGQTLDQVMLSVLRAPRTYTGEDTIEINCHGGLLTARNILALCLQHGARLAEPGEFTKRAFLNGRMDLTQAESVMDLIHARTDRAHAAALHALQGHLSTKVNAIRDQLITILAHIEAHIDFPEEDINPATRADLHAQIQAITTQLDQLLSTAHEGKILREGIRVAIVGRPNVGKSSLMNSLLGHDRSIVTPIPGTTRDTIEEFANIRGIPFQLTDTAGIRNARGLVEQHGVKRSRNSLQNSELVLHILDSSRPFSKGDLELASHYSGKQTIVILNKSDLPRRIKPPASFPKTIAISATKGIGIETLKDQMATAVLQGGTGSSNLDVAINERHVHSLRRAQNTLTNISHKLELEILAQQLRLALHSVGEVVGKTTTEDILTKIFSTFCIGK